MKHPKLTVEERKIFGKKLKTLRREGILPGNVYGKGIKSTAVQVLQKEFDKVYKEVGETGLVDLELKNQTLPVLIHNIATDYKRTFLHADFYKVDLKEKIKAMVPVEAVGEPKAVAEKLGILMQILSEVEVEALPEELPEKIELNVEPLAEVGQQIIVGELKAIDGVQILTDPTQVVVKIDELVSKEAQELAAEEAAKAEEAKAETSEETTAEGAAEGETTEGEAAGEKTTEEAVKTEEKPKEEPTA
jgi:large subunit ribosomal protein L25